MTSETSELNFSHPQYSLIKRACSAGALSAFFFVAGCDDAPVDTARRAAPETPAFSLASARWLDVNDKISPAVWLASREAKRDVAPNDEAAASYRRLLADADVRFTEGPRMIANRAVQVEEMLRERGLKESAREVIEALVSIAPPTERAGFGETCQHYVNARTASPDRAAALEALRREPLPAARPSADEP